MMEKVGMWKTQKMDQRRIVDIITHPTFVRASFCVFSLCCHQFRSNNSRSKLLGIEMYHMFLVSTSINFFTMTNKGLHRSLFRSPKNIYCLKLSIKAADNLVANGKLVVVSRGGKNSAR